MRVPEFLFCVINPAMRLTLRSPIHGFFSHNIMLIRYQGRKSGKSYEIPVRYLDDGGVIKCFTDKSTGWWPNLVDNDHVMLTMHGEDVLCRTTVIKDDHERLTEELSRHLNRFPMDSVYHDVRLDHDRKPSFDDIVASAKKSVLILAEKH